MFWMSLSIVLRRLVPPSSNRPSPLQVYRTPSPKYLDVKVFLPALAHQLSSSRCFATRALGRLVALQEARTGPYLVPYLETFASNPC